MQLTRTGCALRATSRRWATISNRFLSFTAARAQSNAATDTNPADTSPAYPPRPPGLYLYGGIGQFKQPNPGSESQRSADRGFSSTIDDKKYPKDLHYNVSKQILEHVGRKLYLQPNHPLYLTRKLIESAFSEDQGFNNRLEPNPVVTVKENFDDLGFPADHPGRSRTDTYYVNQDHVLRTHTSAHELKLFSELKEDLYAGSHGYTLCSDVFRRDSIDRSHYPVFHQMEGARTWRLVTANEILDPNEREAIASHERRLNLRAMKDDLERLPLWRYRAGRDIDPKLHDQAALDLKAEDPHPNFDPATNPLQPSHTAEEIELVASHLKLSVEFLLAKVFRQAQRAGIISRTEPPRVRWIPTYFPFTSPSWELEVWWQDEWLEILGCGISQQQLLVKAGIPESVGWAWGIGVERLAMLLYGIPDIRLFWSQDRRFLGQFREGEATRFQEFSKYPECYKDVAFWVPDADGKVENGGEEAETLPPPTVGIEGEQRAVDSVATPSPSPSSSGAAAPAGGHNRSSSDSAQHHPSFHENDLAEIVRDIAGPLVENVTLVDEFFSEKKRRRSLCYRIMYRSLERTLTNEEVNEVHEKVRRRMEEQLGVELR